MFNPGAATPSLVLHPRARRVVTTWAVALLFRAGVATASTITLASVTTNTTRVNGEFWEAKPSTVGTITVELESSVLQQNSLRITVGPNVDPNTTVTHWATQQGDARKTDYVAVGGWHPGPTGPYDVLTYVDVHDTRYSPPVVHIINSAPSVSWTPGPPP